MKLSELPGLRVNVDNVVYMPELEAPADRPFRFVYYLTIHNDSEDTVTIKGRKWVVTEENGHTVVVEGDGVVGEHPTLEPGESFTYNSSHVIAEDAVAEGSLLGLTDTLKPVLIRIPQFRMRIPD
jgi:ApaG protein